MDLPPGTDNMSILGLTIDYGPYGWLDDYDPDWTPNTTDAAHRRYRFGTQPHIAQWNLMQLANALCPLIGEHRSATGEFVERYAARLRALGIADEARAEAMKRVNPKYVLRNYLAQLAIDSATEGRPEAIGELLDVMRRPYDPQPTRESYAALRPDWARTRVGCSQLSCSS